MLKTLELWKKLGKIRKRNDIVEIKNKDLRKDFSLTLKLIQLLPIVIVEILEIETKITYLRKF